jgi:hypothetical protein
LQCRIDHAPRKIGASLDYFVPDLPPNVQGNSRLNIVRACDALVLPGTHVVNFLNTPRWMKTSTD